MSNEDKTEHVSEVAISPPAEAKDQIPPAQLEQPQDSALDDAELDKVSGGLWRLGTTFNMPAAGYSVNRRNKKET